MSACEGDVYGTSCAAPLTVANVKYVKFWPFLTLPNDRVHPPTWLYILDHESGMNSRKRLWIADMNIPASYHTMEHNFQKAPASILLQAYLQLSLFVLMGFLNLDLHCSEVAETFSHLRQLGLEIRNPLRFRITHLKRRTRILLLRSFDRRGMILIPRLSLW